MGREYLRQLSLASVKPFRAGRQLRRAKAAGNEEFFVEGSFKTGTHAHTPLEPHGALAGWDNGNLTIYASVQNINQIRNSVLEKYKLSPDQLTIVADHVGGFGSKGGGNHLIQIYMAIDLAKKIGKPVRLILDRAEVISYMGHREESVSTLACYNKDADFRAIGWMRLMVVTQLRGMLRQFLVLL